MQHERVLPRLDGLVPRGPQLASRAPLLPQVATQQAAAGFAHDKGNMREARGEVRVDELPSRREKFDQAYPRDADTV